MIRIITFSILVTTLFCSIAYSQSNSSSLSGTWQASASNDAGEKYTMTMIVTEDYFSLTKYSLLGQKFYSTEGGKITVTGDKINRAIEYNTKDPSQVGSSTSAEFQIMGNKLKMSDMDIEWMRFDDRMSRDFSGAYLITGRKRNGELSRRTPGARKTMKILSGGYFQWIAYNTDTGEFFGTGGGTYTTEDGKYVEHIEFFSRDGSRVGAILSFDYSIQDGEWHHSGLSSKGDPIYEIWTLRSQL